MYYKGFNEGKGIWGKWELTPKEIYGFVHGGFHIWPEDMGDPTQDSLTEAAEAPCETPELVEAGA